MRGIRKGITGFAASVCCLAMMSMTAFANTDTVDAGQYGNLVGELSGTRAVVVSVTSVDKNTDNAYLTTNLDAKNVQGANVATTGLMKSSIGMVKYTLRWRNLPSDSYSVYGTQGIRGGKSYPAAAAYTRTTLN